VRVVPMALLHDRDEWRLSVSGAPGLRPRYKAVSGTPVRVLGALASLAG
jgi:hypothetical protein